MPILRKRARKRGIFILYASTTIVSPFTACQHVNKQPSLRLIQITTAAVQIWSILNLIVHVFLLWYSHFFLFSQYCCFNCTFLIQLFLIPSFLLRILHPKFLSFYYHFQFVLHGEETMTAAFLHFVIAHDVSVYLQLTNNLICGEVSRLSIFELSRQRESLGLGFDFHRCGWCYLPIIELLTQAHKNDSVTWWPCHRAFCRHHVILPIADVIVDVKAIPYLTSRIGVSSVLSVNKALG